nr:MAG TPA: hypothetical protein [Bacteriophage sp.]
MFIILTFFKVWVYKYTIFEWSIFCIGMRFF